MTRKIVPTIMFIVMVFTYFIVGEQAVTAQQPINVEQDVCIIIDSLACEVDGYCNAVYDNDSLYSKDFLRQWENSLIEGIQMILWEYKLTPSDLFEVFEPMYECNCTHLWDFDMDCCIDPWESNWHPEGLEHSHEFWRVYDEMRDEYYAKWQVILSNK